MPLLPFLSLCSTHVLRVACVMQMSLITHLALSSSSHTHSVISHEHTHMLTGGRMFHKERERWRERERERERAAACAVTETRKGKHTNTHIRIMQ